MTNGDMMRTSRRGFLGAAAAFSLAGCAGLGSATGARKTRRWRKGQLHSHTAWSDGHALPEAALALYRAAGFEFVCLSDHEVFQAATDHWVQIEKEQGPWPGRLTEAMVAQAEKLAPGTIETRKFNVRRYARLKAHAELARQFNEPDRFLVVPGMEAARGCHMNVFNVDEELKHYNEGEGVGDLTREGVAKSARIIREEYLRHAKPDNRSFIMMNHPFWSRWDVDPRVMLDLPELTLWEVCNSGADQAPVELDIERAWDFVLAHRLANGGSLVYGTATDDAHTYEEQGRYLGCGLEGGWVCVDCPGELTADNLSQAIVRGDFYSSCGVELEDFGFDAATRTLSVKAKPREGEKLHVDFIATKRNFDRSIVEQRVRAVQKEDYFRLLPVVNETIGRTVKTVDGPVGSYTMSADDLYVRAVVVSDRPSVNRTPHYPKMQCAWVQPVAR